MQRALPTAVHIVSDREAWVAWCVPRRLRVALLLGLLALPWL